LITFDILLNIITSFEDRLIQCYATACTVMMSMAYIPLPARKH